MDTQHLECSLTHRPIASSSSRASRHVRGGPSSAPSFTLIPSLSRSSTTTLSSVLARSPFRARAQSVGRTQFAAIAFVLLISCVRTQLGSLDELVLNGGYSPGQGEAIQSLLGTFFTAVVNPLVQVNTTQTNSAAIIQGLGSSASSGYLFGFTLNACTAANYASFPGKSLMCQPVAAHAVVMIHSAQGITLQTPQIVMNALVTARIWAGNITMWNDPAIAALNPALTLPAAKIVKAARAELIADTVSFMNYLLTATTFYKNAMIAKFGAVATTKFVAQVAAGSAVQIQWVDAANMILFQNTANYTEQVALAAQKKNVLTYGSASDATTYGVNSVLLYNAAGTIVAPTSAAVLYAVEAQGSAAYPQGSAPLNFVNTLPIGAWPIVTVTYLAFSSQAIQGICALQAALVQFALFLYTSPIAAGIASDNQLVLMPSDVVDALGVVQILQNQVLCGASPANPASTSQTSQIIGTPLAQTFVQAQLRIFTNGTNSAVTTSSTATGDSVEYQYTSNGSGTNLEKLQLNEVDFALVIADAMQKSSLDAAILKGFVTLNPLFSFNFVPVHSLPLAATSPPLVLTPSVVAQIIMGKVLFWDDPLITSLNMQLEVTGLPTGQLPHEYILVFLAEETANPDLMMAFIQFLSATASSVGFNFTATGGSIPPTFASLPFIATRSNLTLLSANGPLDSVVLYNTYGFGIALENPAIKAARVMMQFGVEPLVSGNASRSACFPNEAGSADYVPGSGIPVAVARSLPGCWLWTSIVHSAASNNYPASDCTAASAALQFLFAMHSQPDSTTFVSIQTLIGTFGLSSMPSAVRAGVYVRLNALTCAFETILVTLPIAQLISVVVVSTALGLMIVGVIFATSTIAFLAVFAKRAVIKAASPIFMIVQNCGIVFAMACGYVLVTSQPTNASCGAAFWLGNIGLFLTFASFFAKQWRIFKILTRKEMMVSKITDAKLGARMGVYFFTLELGFLLFIQFYDPIVATSAIQPDFPRDSLVFFCSQNHLGLSYTVVSIKAFMLIACLMMAFSSRSLNQQFNESAVIAWTVYLTFFFALVALAIGFLFGSSPPKVTITIAFFMICTAMVAFCAAMVPKIIALFKTTTEASFFPDRNTNSQQKRIGEGNGNGNGSGSAGDGMGANNSDLSAGSVYRKQTGFASLADYVKVPVKTMDGIVLRGFIKVLKSTLDGAEKERDDREKNQSAYLPSAFVPKQQGGGADDLGLGLGSKKSYLNTGAMAIAMASAGGAATAARSSPPPASEYRRSSFPDKAVGTPTASVRHGLSHSPPQKAFGTTTGTTLSRNVTPTPTRLMAGDASALVIGTPGSSNLSKHNYSVPVTGGGAAAAAARDGNAGTAGASRLTNSFSTSSMSASPFRSAASSAVTATSPSARKAPTTTNAPTASTVTAVGASSNAASIISAGAAPSTPVRTPTPALTHTASPVPPNAVAIAISDPLPNVVPSDATPSSSDASTASLSTSVSASVLSPLL